MTFNSYTSGTKNNYLFNGVEQDPGTGNYEMRFRGYDPALGRFNTVDPMADQRSWVSPYNFVQNNPIIRVDPTGALDDYVFNEEGKYVRTDKNDKPDKLVIENSKTGSQTSYEFNDPETDVKAIEYNIKKFGESFKDRKFVYTIDDNRINEMMKESGVGHIDSDIERWLFAAFNSRPGGKTDFSAYHLPIELAKAGEHKTWNIDSELFGDKGPMFLFNNTSRAYNYLDAGNWLWGNSVFRIGGSQKNAINWAQTFNPWDTYADQYAIQQGYFYGAGFKEPKK